MVSGLIEINTFFFFFQTANENFKSSKWQSHNCRTGTGEEDKRGQHNNPKWEEEFGREENGPYTSIFVFSSPLLHLSFLQFSSLSSPSPRPPTALNRWSWSRSRAPPSPSGELPGDSDSGVKDRREGEGAVLPTPKPDDMAAEARAKRRDRLRAHHRPLQHLPGVQADRLPAPEIEHH